MSKVTQKKTLSQWRRQRELSVQAFADALDISVGQASDYLNGRREPSVTRALKMAQVLQVQVEEVDWNPERKKADVPLPAMPDGQGVTPERLAVAQLWLAQGVKKDQIAQALGISRTTLYKYL